MNALTNALILTDADINAAYIAKTVVRYTVNRAEDNHTDKEFHFDLTDADFEIIADSLAGHFDEYDRPAYILVERMPSKDRKAIRELANLIYKATIIRFLAEE